MAELETEIAEGRKAISDFVARARSVGPERWNAPRAPGKWSPAQVCDHVSLALEAGRKTLCGECGSGMPRWIRPLLRVLFLNRVLKTGRFPKGSKAPPEFQPSASPGPAAENLKRLEKVAADFDAEARRRGGEGDVLIEHPVFGRIKVVDYVRLNSLHTIHHAAQLG